MKIKEHELTVCEMEIHESVSLYGNALARSNYRHVNLFILYIYIGI